MMSLTKNPHAQAKKFFSSAIYSTGQSAIGGGARALVRQPKTAVFFAKIAKTSQTPK